VELEVAVELGLHVDGAQRELVDRGAAAERGRLLLVRRAGAADGLVAGAGSEAAPLVTIVLALPAVEVEVAVVEEVTKVKIVPVETGLLLVGTLVVGVAGAREGRSPVELCVISCQSSRQTQHEGKGTRTYSSRHASGEGQDGNEGLHVDVLLKMLLIRTNVERETTG
jgi:hypothetical protein